MILRTEDRDFEITPNNSAFLFYDNDLLNGFYHDLSDTEYFFLPQHTATYDKVAEAALSDGDYPIHRYNTGEYNLDEPIHRLVISAIQRLLLTDAEQLVREAEDNGA